MRVGAILPALSAALALAPVGCGNARQHPPPLGRIGPPGPFVAYANTHDGVSFGHPQSWIAVSGRAPLVVKLEQGSALVAIYRYPRTDLPLGPAGVEHSRRRLLGSLARRAPSFRVESSDVTAIDSAPAVEIRGSGRIGRQRVRSLSVHVYKSKAEFVIDAYAAPRVFDRAERVAFDPLLDSLQLRNPLPVTPG